MRNKKLVVVAALLCAALATAGIAIAKAKSGGIAPASATFSATSITKSVTKTCTINGGDTYALSHATYTGTATSTDARLNGPITINAWSIVDQTTGHGALVGHFKVGAPTTHADGKLEASLSGGQASGMVRAHLHGPSGELFAGLNGGFTASGGFATGSAFGSGSSTDSGVVLSHGACVHSIPLDW